MHIIIHALSQGRIQEGERPPKIYESNFIYNAHLGLSDRNNRGVKFTQHWNSAAHNCKSSLRKCIFEYESSQEHTYGANVRARKYMIIFRDAGTEVHYGGTAL